MIALTHERLGFDESTTNIDQLVDGVHLPRQVIQANTPTPRCIAHSKESEVVMIVGTTRAQEHCASTSRFLHRLKAKYIAIERSTSLGIRHVQHGVIESANLGHSLRLRSAVST